MCDWKNKEYIKDSCWSIIRIVLYVGLVLGVVFLIGFAIAENIRETYVPNEEEVVVKYHVYTSDDYSKADSLLNEYSRLMLEHDLSGNLNYHNNPYGITIRGELVYFSSVEDAHKVAVTLLHEYLYKFDVNKDPIMLIFSEMFGDSMYYTNIPGEPIRW